MQSERTMWSPVHWGPVKTIVALCVIVFVGQLLFRQNQVIERYFACSLLQLKSGHVWTPVSYAFLHSTERWMHLIFNMLVLWMFGRSVEGMLGPRRFWFLFLGAAVAGALAHVACGLATGSAAGVIGASAGLSAVVAVFAFHNPRATLYLMMVIPMPAILLVVIFAVIDLLGLFNVAHILGGDIGHGAHLGGLAFGAGFWFLVVRRGITLPSFPGLPRRRRRRRSRSREEPRVDDAELDRILSKITRDGGTDKLGVSEREFLDKVSRRYRRDD